MMSFDELCAQDTTLAALAYADHVQIYVMVSLICKGLRAGQFTDERAGEMFDNALRLYALTTDAAQVI